MADFLDTSTEIMSERPSLDMFKGVGDEKIIGISYERIDKYLYAIENDLSEGYLNSQGIKISEYSEIKRIYELSEWKRENEHVHPSFSQF